MVKRPPPPYDVEVEINGKTHRGTYRVEGHIITVSYFGGGSKSTQLGAADRDLLARRLLRELVGEAPLRERHVLFTSSSSRQTVRAWRLASGS